jgi:hypothetical protein
MVVDRADEPLDMGKKGMLRTGWSDFHDASFETGSTGSWEDRVLVVFKLHPHPTWSPFPHLGSHSLVGYGARQSLPLMGGA